LPGSAACNNCISFICVGQKDNTFNNQSAIYIGSDPLSDDDVRPFRGSIAGIYIYINSCSVLSSFKYFNKNIIVPAPKPNTIVE